MSDANNEEAIVMPATTSDKPVVEESTTPQVTADSSTASEENHEEKTNGVQQRINDLTAKRYKAERERDELAQKLAEASKAPVEQAQPQAELKAPPLPDDLYDEEAMRQYHAANQKYVADMANNAARSQFESQKNKSLEEKQRLEQQKVLDKYTSNAMRDGVDLDKLRVVEQTLNQAGISPQLGSYIMNDNNGAKVAEYLNDNPAEMYEILQLDPVSAGIRIANEIKPKVLSQTPKVSNAPDPIPEVKGGGYVEVDDFDKKYPGAQII